MLDSDLFVYLVRFIVITLVLGAALWGLRWYVANKLQPHRPRTMIKVVERALLAPGKQGMVVEVDQQRFFVVMSDKHTSVTELSPASFARALQEEASNASDISS